MKYILILFVAIPLLNSCYKPCRLCDEEILKNKVIVNTEIDKDSIFADGNDAVTITVHVSIEADRNLKVDFEASEGKFESSGTKTTSLPHTIREVTRNGITTAVSTDSTRVAVARLTGTNKTGLITVKIKFTEHVQKVIVIPTKKAYPQEIELNTDVFSIDSGFANPITIDFELKRKKGIPTKGHKVSFAAFDTDTSLGHFNPAFTMSDIEGKGSVVFVAGLSDYEGWISLIGTSTVLAGGNCDNTVICDTIKLYLSQ